MFALQTTNNNNDELIRSPSDCLAPSYLSILAASSNRSLTVFSVLWSIVCPINIQLPRLLLITREQGQ